MRRKFQLFTIILVLVTAFCKQTTAQTNKTTALITLQNERFAAMVKSDTNYLKSMVDDGLVYIHSNGLVQDKQAFISSITNRTIVYHAIEPVEQQVRVYEKSAVINGVVKVKGSINNKAFDISLRFTDVYRYQKKWIMVSWQSLKL